MKKLIILFSVFCITSIACGQEQFSLEKEFTSNPTRFYTEGGLHVMGQWQSQPGNTTTGLLQILEHKDSISLISRLNIGGENSRLIHLIPKDEGGFVGIYYEEGCRYAARGNFIFHLDNALGIVKEPERIEYFFRNIREPILYANYIYKNTLVLATHNQVCTYDIATYRAISYNDTLSTYDYIVPLNNSFACVENDKFHKFNVFCNVVGTQLMGYNAKKLLRLNSQNGFIGIGSKQLSVLNNQGLVVFEQNWQYLNNEFDSLITGFYVNDTLVVLGKQNSSFKLAQMTNQFSIINAYKLGNSRINNRKVELKDFYLSSNKIYCIKSFLKGVEKFSYIEKYKRSSSVIQKNFDIDIVFVSIDSISSNNEKKLACVFYGSYTVANSSKDTVSQFMLKWKSSTNPDCSGPQFSSRVNCNIAPGSFAQFNYQLSDSSLIPESGYSLCLNVMAPNSALDTVYLNNISCTNTVLPPVSIAEKNLKAPRLPSLLKAGQIVEVPFNLKHCSLFSLSGQRFSLSHNNATFKTPSDFTEGLYILLIETETRVYRKRILLVN